MPAASIIDDLGEEEVEVKMSSAAPQSSEYNCNLHSIVPPTKLKKKTHCRHCLSDSFCSAFLLAENHCF